MFTLRLHMDRRLKLPIDDSRSETSQTRRRVMKRASALFVAVLLAPVGEKSAAGAETASANAGAYAGVEVGFAIAPAATLRSTQNNAIADTRCDLHFAGEAGFPETAADYRSFEYAAGRRCSDRVEDFWLDEFDENSVGVMAGLVLGYRGVAGLPLRVEMEYFYRNNGFDAVSGQTPQTGTAANKDAEFLAGFGKLNDVRAHGLFANVYFDFPDVSGVSPYAGIGVGWSRTTYEIRQHYQRGYADTVPEAAQGTVSALDDSFSDDLPGLQIIAGFDYWLTSEVSVGIKLRRVWFDTFASEKRAWDVLRGHASTKAPEALVAPAGITDNRILYSAETGDTSFWGVAMSVKYGF